MRPCEAEDAADAAPAAAGPADGGVAECALPSGAVPLQHCREETEQALGLGHSWHSQLALGREEWSTALGANSLQEGHGLWHQCLQCPAQVGDAAGEGVEANCVKYVPGMLCCIKSISWCHVVSTVSGGVIDYEQCIVVSQ